MPEMDTTIPDRTELTAFASQAWTALEQSSDDADKGFAAQVFDVQFTLSSSERPPSLDFLLASIGTEVEFRSAYAEAYRTIVSAPPGTHFALPLPEAARAVGRAFVLATLRDLRRALCEEKPKSIGTGTTKVGVGGGLAGAITAFLISHGMPPPGAAGVATMILALLYSLSSSSKRSLCSVTEADVLERILAEEEARRRCREVYI